MIKIKERAKIEETFIDAYKDLAREWLQLSHQKLASFNDYSKKAYLAKNRYVMGRLSQILQGRIEPGKGLDYERARLRSLPFERFFFEQEHFIGLTDNVIVDEFGRGTKVKGKKYVARYDAGQYLIAVPFSTLRAGSLAAIHMIPARDQATRHRHAHHIGSAYEGTLRRLDSSTCWAEFAAPCQSASQTADVVELFRLLRIFVGRYNNLSPLTREMVRAVRSFYEQNRLVTRETGHWELLP